MKRKLLIHYKMKIWQKTRYGLKTWVKGSYYCCGELWFFWSKTIPSETLRGNFVLKESYNRMSRQIHFQIESFLFLSPGNNTRKQMIVKVFLNFFIESKSSYIWLKTKSFFLWRLLRAFGTRTMSEHVSQKCSQVSKFLKKLNYPQKNQKPNWWSGKKFCLEEIDKNLKLLRSSVITMDMEPGYWLLRPSTWLMK